MVIDFLNYVEAQQTQCAAVEAEGEAERSRRARLDNFLTDLLVEFQAA